MFQKNSQKKYKDQDPKGYKHHHNEILLNMVQQYCSSNSSKKALYLDGPALLSTKIFAPYFDSLLIPQFSFQDYQQMISPSSCLPSHVEVVYTSLQKIMENRPEYVQDCTLAYFDTMNCIYGSIENQNYPLHDLDQLLKQSLQSRLIVGLTFVSKMYPVQDSLPLSKKDHEFALSFVQETHRPSTTWIWREFVYPVIYSRGWMIQECIVREYCKDVSKSAPMVFYALVLQKCHTSLPIPTFWFHLHPSGCFRLGFDQTFPDEQIPIRKSSARYRQIYKKYYNVSKKRWKLFASL